MNPSDTAVKRSLDSLSDSKKLAFVLLLCERMMPTFQVFGADTGFDVSRYQKYVETAWAHLDGESPVDDWAEASEVCFDSAPDTEAFDHVLTSSALNAALSIGLAMSYLSDRNIDHILEATDLARDTVALYVQSIEATSPKSLTYEEVMNHPLLQQELLRQEEDLIFLSSLPDRVEQKEVWQIKERSQRTPGLVPL